MWDVDRLEGGQRCARLQLCSPLRRLSCSAQRRHGRLTRRSSVAPPRWRPRPRISPRSKRPHVARIGERTAAPGTTGSAAGIIAGARPADHYVWRSNMPASLRTGEAEESAKEVWRLGESLLAPPRRRRVKTAGTPRPPPQKRSRLRLRLIGDPPEAFLAPQHGEHVEDAGRGRAAGQRGAERLGDRAELRALDFGISAHDRLGG